MSNVSGSILLLGFLALPMTASAADEGDFRTRVAPIFESRCVRCHGPENPKGGLSLATGRGLRDGGDSGPAVVPGRPEESLLLEMIAGPTPEMPRNGDPLPAEHVAGIRRWIEQGAPWPEGVVLKFTRPDEGPWWSLTPLVRPEIPRVKDTGWIRTPIDAFLLEALEARGLSPGPEADRRTLIRRLTFDLHGLPPTPEEIDAFLDDTAPDAYERLVDRLLASPHYGERWGRHWLDVVHYGDTHGYDKDKPRRNAWPYRDYVIGALNADRPYARFIREQIAGDVLFPDDPAAVIATGFVAAGPWDFVGHTELREGTVDKAKARLLDRDDMLANTMSTFVSLTVHCARCHDHKFDPIPQNDYYRLQAVFAGVDRGDRPNTPHQAAGQVLVYALTSIPPRPIHLLRRGDVEQPGEPVTPGALSCVPGLDGDFRLARPDDEGSRRAALAEWVADPRNVLTWRSIVNRVWQYHFGRGLVETPNDFGRNGAPPSHPELLDWLAVEFRDGGGSLKALHRLIVRSAAYRQGARDDRAAAAVDAENRLLWRMDRRRLDAESLRDAVLAVSGTLDSTMGGPGVELFRFKDDHSPVYDHDAPEKLDTPEARRRTVYRFVVRSVPNPLLDCLDAADPNVNTPVRNTTITALQALALLNDAFIVAQARHFAERLQRMSDDPRRQVEIAYALAFGRPPLSDECDALVEYATRHGLAGACRILFNANEFVFVD
jgi:mono/diheme cytochrome c family protein